jgi:hypothetical protein
MLIATTPQDASNLLTGDQRVDELAKMLSFYLENFESQWDTIKPYCEYQEGEHYIRCAEWMRVHYKRRDSGIIWRVREFLESKP